MTEELPIMPSLADATGVTTETPPANETPADQPPAELPAGDDLLFSPKKEEAPAGEEKPDEETKPDDEAPADQPIQYEPFEIPDDMPAPADAIDEFTKFAQENKLTQEQAQRALSMHIKMQERAIEGWENTKMEWRKEVMDDPNLGGNNLSTTIANANQIVDKFVSSPEHKAEFQKDLIGLGLGNKKSFVEFLTNIHKLTAGDSIAGTFANSSGSAPKDTAKLMWPDMA